MEHHLALYRKYRPKSFDEVIGQDHVVNTLKNQVKTGEISHAYLFTGTRGTGKTSCAKILARAVNCLNPQNGSPCGECEVCKALEGVNMDVVEIDAASNNSVDDVRDMIASLKFMPVYGKYKVFIIDEVHMLSLSAFNALLKSIEEPPTHVIFILATTEVHKIPATILSRVMRFNFKLVSVEELAAHVKKIFKESGITADDESVRAIAVAGEGSVRDTLSVADCVSAYANKNIKYLDVQNALGISDKPTLLELTEAIISGNVGDLFSKVQHIYLQGKNMSVLVKDMTLHIRDLLIAKSCTNPNELLCLPNDLFIRYKAQASRVSSETLLIYLNKFTQIESELRYASSPRVLFEVTALSCLKEGSIEAKNRLKNDFASTTTNAQNNKSAINSLNSDLTEISNNFNPFEQNSNNNNLTKVDNKSSKTASLEEFIPQIEAYSEPPIELEQLQEQKTNVFDSTQTKIGTVEDVHSVWGKLVSELRSRNYFVLHALCGGISDVLLEGNLLVVYSEKDSVLESLNREENVNILKDVLKSLGYKYTLEFRKKITRRTIAKENVAKLTALFGNDIKISD